MSYVTEFPAAEPQESVTHFLRRLSVETDCADVHHAIANNEQDFVLLHVVGSPEQFARRHVPGRHRGDVLGDGTPRCGVPALGRAGLPERGVRAGRAL